MNHQDTFIAWHRPSKGVAIATWAVLTLTWIGIRLVVFPDVLAPFTYMIPLVLCVWMADVRLVWAMAAAFSTAQTIQWKWLFPGGATPPAADDLAFVATLFNIVVGAALTHALIKLREQIEHSNRSLREAGDRLQIQAEELQAQSEELAQQNEELAQQSEQLAAQSEELQQQNEELQAQSEESQALTTELGHREALLHVLLDSALASTEEHALERIATAAIGLFGETASAIAVYESHHGELQCHSVVCRDGAVDFRDWPADPLASLAFRQRRTAGLADRSLRPDLQPQAWPERRHFEAALCAPIVSGASSLGCVTVLSATRHEWTTEEFRLAEWTASQAARMLDIIRLQADVRRNELKYREFFEHLDEVVFVLAPQRDNGGAVVDWTCVDANAEALELLSRPRTSVLARSLHELAPGFVAPESAPALAAVLATGRPHRSEVVFEDRQYRQVAFPIAGDQIVVAALDITEHRDAENALRETDRQKNEFLATLSHELRNPLAPIRFALSLLESGSEESARARGVIDRQITHMVRLVDDLLDLTRISTNKIRLRKQRLDLHAVVRQAVESVFQTLERESHHITLSIPGELPPLVGDPDRLIQVLTNLLSNAARYTPAGGHIAVRASSTDGHVSVSVTDDGVGMLPEDCDRIFEMFAQGDNGGHEGLGIGLALVKALIHLHGGTVKAHSDGPGRGTAFVIELPVSGAMAEESIVHERLPIGVVAQPQRILIVDDNVDSAEMMAAFLEAKGQVVHLAYDGPGALEAVEEFRPDVAFLDIGLPGLDGYQVARRLREDPRTRGTYLVAITGWGQDRDRERAADAGFDTHLTKPADLAQVETLLARARNGRAL